MEYDIIDVLKAIQKENIFLTIFEGENSEEEKILNNNGEYIIQNRMIHLLFKGENIDSLELFPSEDSKSFFNKMQTFCLKKEISLEYVKNLLIHEFGHHLSAKAGLLTQEKSKLYYNAKNNIPGCLNEHKQGCFEEEVRAWDLGRQYFKDIINIRKFEEQKKIALDGYKNALFKNYTNYLVCVRCSQTKLRSRKNIGICYKCK